jgi:hypothetical protein
MVLSNKRLKLPALAGRHMPRLEPCYCRTTS